MLIFHCMLQMGNKGAFIRFKAPDLKPDIVTFSAVVSIFCILLSAMVSYIGSWDNQVNEVQMNIYLSICLTCLHFGSCSFCWICRHIPMLSQWLMQTTSSGCFNSLCSWLERSLELPIVDAALQSFCYAPRARFWRWLGKIWYMITVMYNIFLA